MLAGIDGVLGAVLAAENPALRVAGIGLMDQDGQAADVLIVEKMAGKVHPRAAFNCGVYRLDGTNGADELQVFRQANAGAEAAVAFDGFRATQAHVFLQS